MLWSELKLATMQKMFAADGGNIPTDESTKDYLAGMPQAANEALLELSKAGKFIIKSLQISHNPIENLLPDSISMKIHQTIGGDIEFNSDRGMSYFFEATGKGIAIINVDDVEQITIEIDSKNGYTSYKGLIDNADSKSVNLKLSSPYPMAAKNIAIYDATFELPEDVQVFAEKVRYKLSDYVDDFFQLANEGIYYEGENPRYVQTSDYFQEGNKVLVLNRAMAGNFTIYYKAYPPTITASTLDEYELPIDPEVAVLLPLYMASQLYKDDDNGIATTYRNEFEVAFERLSDAVGAPVAEQFTSESGWI